MTTTQPPDLGLLTAQRVHRLPPEWRAGVYRSLHPLGLELTGAEPIGTISRGPRKGRPKWPPRNQWRAVLISAEQVAETRRQWEAETGLCSWCGGGGQQVHRVSVTEGVSYRTCMGCGGTGKAGGGSVQP
jgi:hypothetical protein